MQARLRCKCSQPFCHIGQAAERLGDRRGRHALHLGLFRQQPVPQEVEQEVVSGPTRGGVECRLPRHLIDSAEPRFKVFDEGGSQLGTSEPTDQPVDDGSAVLRPLAALDFASHPL